VKGYSLKSFTERCAGQFGVGDDGEFSFILTDAVAETYKLTSKRRGRRKRLPEVNSTKLNKNDWRIQPNTAAWQAITKFALQVGVNPWMNGQAICLTRPNYEADPSIYGPGLITDRKGGSNTLSADLRLTSQNRYAAYKGKIQTNVKGPTKTITVKGKPKKTATMKTVTRRASAIDPSPAFWIHSTDEEIRVGADPLIAKFGAQSGTRLADRHARVRELRGQWYGDEALMKRAVRAEMEKNALDGWEYTVTVEGLAAENGAYWTIDTMVNVLDTTQDGYMIDRPMYIVAIEETLLSGDDKPVVTLTLIPPKIWLYYEQENDDEYINSLKQQIDF
jgi:prophage tail gpP-like protein